MYMHMYILQPHNRMYMHMYILQPHNHMYMYMYFVFYSSKLALAPPWNLGILSITAQQKSCAPLCLQNTTFAPRPSSTQS